ncbi:hypothetical protein GCM10007913_13060 [Devosia yakushimensis]|uniref:Uncharacterized protein n=2 Tax=Devosia yakushimensis TaxID=470028 RepID=A0ABQ5UBY0_9HYPH|nr:hypothetical protein GCM10007913_13060 [Devosia yakushimensis]
MFRVSAWASLIVLLACSAAAMGEDEAHIPDTAIEVDVSDDITIDFSQIDVMTSKDPIPLLAGITDQFGGETVLGEVELKVPIARADFDALMQARASKAMSFQCERGGLYEVEGTRLVAGDSCEMIIAEEADQ